MPIIPKYKLNALAKNFNMKAKDIIDVLAQHDIPGKSTMTALEDNELNIIFEYLTYANQVEDIEPYMYNREKPTLEVPTPADIPEPVKEKAEAAVVSSEVKEIEADIDTKENQETQKENKITATEQKQNETREPKVEQDDKKLPPNTNVANAGKQQPQRNADRQGVQNQQQKPQQANQQQKPRQNLNFKPYQPRPQQPPQQTAAATTPAQGQQGMANQTKTDTSNISKTSAKPNSKREFAAPVFNKDASKSNKNIRQRNPAFNSQNQQQNQRKSDSKTTVDIISSSDVNIKLEAGVRSNSAKIIDTRTSTVDLSRYDEKLNNFVSTDSEKAFSNNRNDRQRSKKNVNQQKISYDRAGRPIDKERIALEKLKKQQELEKAKKKQLAITLPEEIIVSDLASKLRITSAEVVKKLFLLGIKASVNEAVDYETAALLAMEFGAKVEKEVIVTIEDKLFDESVDTVEMLQPRAPVVVVMGHVDHGKTSLLDAIKNTNVTAGEAGGITQHIGAYRVELNGREITFLDTPGHAAFTAMRARGAQVTDIAILVVAASEGIMPQTIEAINHAKAANVSIIVAINKMDLPQADANRVIQELTAYDLVPEEWGGDVICVPVSAHTKQGLDELLEMVLLTADMKELKANPSRLAQGVIIEAKLDKGKGPVATMLVQNGTLNVGDIVIAGTTVGRVRAMSNDRGKNVKSAGPSVPVEIVGLSETPNAGDSFRAVEDERMARELVDQRKSEEKEEIFKISSNVTLEDLFSQVASGVKELNIILKADVQGSVEALRYALIKESTEEVKIKVIHNGVGGITESDIMLASASNAIVVGFNVRPDKAAIDTAERNKVDVRTYRVIYECIEEVNAAIKGMLAPKFKESVLGHAQVRQTIRVPNIGTIAGSYVQDGKVARNSQIRVIRDGIVIFEDKIDSLRRFKDDVREVAQGYECGIGLEKFNDIRELDILESFIIEQIAT